MIKVRLLTKTPRVENGNETANVFDAQIDHSNIRDVISQLSTAEFVELHFSSGGKTYWRCDDIVSLREIEE